ncbi:MAG TPA: glycosyltransferase family 4 protein [Candidatus Udaeobacter sp.]|jgi:glycosyltransferase involved in cell wall biosynthesis|nr:glycosyltransferase family 4 protein [Candidatus Udaeobacter sp.]
MRLGYFYSRYPVISHTFCDAEMLGLERLGFDLTIGSIYPPLTSLRHEHIANLRAPIHYAPPQEILRILEHNANAAGTSPRDLVQRHERKYGAGVKAQQRAHNALYFADFFTRQKVDHVHVHFANRAAHTALFLKEISGIPFSVTAHGQDFMKDLGSDDLLREICAAAEFVAAETNYSRDLLRKRCPDSAAKIHRVYNGIDLERFPTPVSAPHITTIPRIVSVGRLVAFKGFEHLIDACAELAGRGLDFVCDIIGGGPLRETLHAKIETMNLGARIKLLGSLSQRAVLEKLSDADIFALASTMDAQGATDVFPTVILEAMASARPVVATRLAGIPELVVDGETGGLVSPGDTGALANALEQLLRDRDLRMRYGRAGRARVEQHFRIENTVAPLIHLLEQSCSRRHAGDAHGSHSDAATGIAYLIDRWPDNQLPLLERELGEMKRRKLVIMPIVSELDSTVRLNRGARRIAPSLEFLPDAMVLEAEWRANRELAQKLEEERAQQSVRVPSAIFLRQARFALGLRKLLREKNISHVHATSSRALVCALILKKLLGVTVSATIEPRSETSAEWIQIALSQCVGGRLANRRLLKQLGSSFIFDKTTFSSTRRKALGAISRKTGMDLSAGAHFWQQWAGLLLRWSCNDRKSTIENRK